MTAIVMSSHDLRTIAREIPELAAILRSAIVERTAKYT
jgi:hypothetical protein